VKTKLLTAALVALAVSTPTYAQNAMKSDAMIKEAAMTEMKADSVSAYADVLARNLVPGDDGVLLFDYASAKENGDHETIKAFIADQAALKPSQMSDAEAVAYWGNLYNAITLDVVLDDYPIKSIRSLGPLTTGPWKRKVVTVEGEVLSLDNIEHDIMRVDFASPYVHYMVNCASIGCPNVQTELWTAENLDEMRRKGAAEFINSDRGVTIDRKGRIAVSKIYKWFSEDFGDTEADLRAHLATYATGEKLEALTSGAKFKGSHYDWDLNAVK
jgi:hypothetical protein